MTIAVSGQSDVVWDYDYDQQARLTERRYTQGENSGSMTYEYDKMGNMTLARVDENTYTTFDWDYENRLVEQDWSGDVGLVGGPIYYSYDPSGLLAWESHEDAFGENEDRVRVWAYDGLTPIVEKVLGSDTYNYLVTGASVGGIAARWDQVDDKIGWYHYNHLGTLRKVVNWNGGNTDKTVTCDAFGAETTFTGSGLSANDVRAGLTTKQLHPTAMHLTDDETTDNHFYYFAARWYDAGVGRFLGRDPDTLHRQFPMLFWPYAYASNNPLNYVDPSGWAADAAPDKVEIPDWIIFLCNKLCGKAPPIVDKMCELYCKALDEIPKCAVFDCVHCQAMTKYCLSTLPPSEYDDCKKAGFDCIDDQMADETEEQRKKCKGGIDF